jgi:hypothetical protein
MATLSAMGAFTKANAQSGDVSFKKDASMRAYVIVSGLVFLVLFLIHGARLVAEGTGPLHEPDFIATSLVSLGLALGAAMTFRTLRNSSLN